MPKKMRGIDIIRFLLPSPPPKDPPLRKPELPEMLLGFPVIVLTPEEWEAKYGNQFPEDEDAR